MRPLIEICVSNEASDPEFMKLLEDIPDCDVIDYGCLGFCGECFAQPYVLIDGEFVAGEDLDDLLQKVKQYVKEAMETGLEFF